MLDYIIVGGGLSGCVLASRLKQYDASLEILLVEAGQDTRLRPEVLNPHLLNLGGDLDWQYQSEPVPALSNRAIVFNSGKGLGGGSAINSGGWTRGSAADYDEWAALVGDERYSYKGQLPWLKKAEHWFDDKNLDQHGRDGPVNVVSSASAKRQFPLSKHSAPAWEDLGVKPLPDMDQNAGNNLGIAALCEARLEGKRQWSASAYSLEGVQIRLNTSVHKIILESAEGAMKATGVQLADGSVVQSKNIVLSAGAFRSPQLLQLSGIGSSSELTQAGIEPLVDAPDVGKHLTDHTLSFQHWRLTDAATGFTLGSPNPLFNEPQFLQGNPTDLLVSTTVKQQGLVEAIKKDEGAEPSQDSHPLLSKPRTFLEHVLIHAKVPFPGVPMDTDHVTTAVITFLPTSRGSVSLRSSNPEDMPIIVPNYLDTEVDRYVHREGLRQLSSLMYGPKMSQFISGESVPEAFGLEPLGPDDSDEKLNKRIALTTGTSWHPTGTCSMGKVVDTDFRVKGVQGLRVVDASVIPVPLSAHIQAPLYGLTEQAAAIILGKN